jgi:hypothetical protein
MHDPVPDVITRVFEADARRDIDAIVALFTDDAVSAIFAVRSGRGASGTLGASPDPGEDSCRGGELLGR